MLLEVFPLALARTMAMYALASDHCSDEWSDWVKTGLAFDVYFDDVSLGSRSSSHVNLVTRSPCYSLIPSPLFVSLSSYVS